MQKYKMRSDVFMVVCCLLLLVVIGVSSSKTKQTGSTSNWTSQGGHIYLNGKQVALKGVSWFGFETNLNVFHGLWAVDYHFIFNFLKENQFNAMRIPFNLDMVLNDPMPTSVSFGYCSNNVSCNLGLKGLSSLQVLDTMIRTAGEYGIAVMLDLHSFEPDAFQANGLWYDATHPVSVVLKGWKLLLSRYTSYNNVLSIDLKNEPFACTWLKGQPLTDWQPAIAMLGNYIHTISDSWLIFAEGVASDPPCAENCFFGGNLQGVKYAPANLTLANKLVYSPHCYGPSVFMQPYFQASNFPANMPAIWDTHFGFIRSQNGPAVVVGEWGGHTAGLDGIWLNAWVDYLIQKDMRDTFFWCVNPDSGDTGGLLSYDWITPIPAKLTLLNRLQPNPTVFKF